MITGSAVGRVLACPASAVLPQRDYSTSASADGVARHADLEAAIDTGDHDALPVALDLLLADYPVRRTEIALAYDVASDTATLLGVTNRAYPSDLPTFAIPMTLDLVAIADGRLLVVDHKGHSHVGDPRQHGQLLTQALAASRAWPARTVTAAISYPTTGRLEAVDLDDLDLDGHAARLRQMFADVAAASSDVAGHLATGPHCRYCPAFDACPRQQDLSLTMAGGSVINLDSDTEAALALELLSRVKLLATRMEHAINARAKLRPVPLGDGRVYGLRSKPGREKIDGAIAYQAALAAYGKSVADQLVEFASTKSKIKAVAKAAAGSTTESAASIERLILGDVRKAGGISRGPATEVYEAFALGLAPGEGEE